jgi:prepilin-type N-terminal cleavage/methylation domain-containing protein
MNYQKGFTLIEVVIATALVAIIGLVIYQAYSEGILIWKRSQITSEQERVVIFLEKFSRELKNTFVFSPIGFNGEENKISFPSVLQQYLADEKEEADAAPSQSLVIPLLSKLSYEYKPTEEEILRIQKVYAYPDIEELKNNPELTKNEISKVVLEGVEKISFSYAITGTSGVKFSNSFSPEKDAPLPYAVKIEVKLKTMKEPLNRTIFIPVNKFLKNEKK